MEKLNFPGTDWLGLALIGAQKKPLESVSGVLTSHRAFHSLSNVE